MKLSLGPLVTWQTWCTRGPCGQVRVIQVEGSYMQDSVQCFNYVYVHCLFSTWDARRISRSRVSRPVVRYHVRHTLYNVFLFSNVDILDWLHRTPTGSFGNEDGLFSTSIKNVRYSIYTWCLDIGRQWWPKLSRFFQWHICPVYIYIYTILLHRKVDIITQLISVVELKNHFLSRYVFVLHQLS